MGMGSDGMGWDGMGWDGMGKMITRAYTSMLSFFAITPRKLN